MKLITRITNIRWEPATFAFISHDVQDGYVCDVHVFHDKVVEIGGNLWPQRLYKGEYLSITEPISKNLEDVAVRCMEKYRKELVEAAQLGKKMMIQKDKEEKINQKFLNFTVEE